MQKLTPRLALLISLLSLFACATPRPQAQLSVPPAPPVLVEKKTPDWPKEISRITIAAVGDVLMHETVKKSAEAVSDDKKSGYENLFADVTPDLKFADIAFANLETPIAPNTGASQKPFVFNSPPVVVEALKEIGIDIVSVANNHIYDQGLPAISETMDHLEKAKLPYVGLGKTKAEAQRPYIFDLKNIRVAFLGYAEFFNSDLTSADPNEPTANKINIDDIKAAIKASRQQADVVVVSLHWGVEYQTQPTKQAKEWAREFFEAGADVILGHHPHVLQPIEVYKTSDGRNCFVVYSLGNFISNQSRAYVPDVTPNAVGDTRDGVILYFDFVKRDYGPAGTAVELSHVRALPVWVENDELTRKNKNAPVIRVKSIDKTIDALVKQRDQLRADDKAAFIQLSQTIKSLKLRRGLIAERMGEDYIVKNADLAR